MGKKRVTVVITDLDNTLFDWFEQWYYAFNAQINEVSRISGIPLDKLKAEAKKVHQSVGTSEYLYLLQNLPSLRARYPESEIPTVFDAAIHEFRKKRKRHLRIYPGVIVTLRRLKDLGCTIVGYTDSMGYYTGFRVRRLGLDGVLDYLYSPPDHPHPEGTDLSKLRRNPPEEYEFKFTTHKILPEGEVKPNPKVLLDIIDEVGGIPSETVYIGDNLYKDILMAKEANVIDVHADYGTAHDREEYKLLVDVTHWTDVDVEQEKELKKHHVKPSHILKNGFWEVLELFDFCSRFKINKDPWLSYRADHIATWKKIVDVQMHFNDIEMKIRGLAMTFIVAAAGAYGFTLKENMTIPYFDSIVYVRDLVLAISILIWPLFYFMDRHWYHRLLYGAVKAGLVVEEDLERSGVSAPLTSKIGEESPIIVAGCKIRSTNKLDLWYLFVESILIIGFAFSFPNWVTAIILFILSCVWLSFVARLQRIVPGDGH